MKKWLALAPLAVLCYMPQLLFAQTEPTVEFSVSEYIAIDQSAVANFKINNHQEGNQYAVKLYSDKGKIEVLHPVNGWISSYATVAWAAMPTTELESANISYRITQTSEQQVEIKLRLRQLDIAKNLPDPLPQSQTLIESDLRQVTILPDEDQLLIDADAHYLIISDEEQSQLYSNILSFDSENEAYTSYIPSFLNQEPYVAHLLDQRNQIVSAWPLNQSDEYFYTLSEASCETIDLPSSVSEFSRISLPAVQCTDMQSRFLQEDFYAPEYPLAMQIKQLYFNSFNYFSSELHTIATEKIHINLLNEFNPLSEEWVELYNDSELELNLCGFYLDDIEGGSSPIILSENCIMAPKSYLLFNLSKSILNDDGDTLRLLSPTKQVWQEIAYIKGTGQSFACFGTIWQWTNTATPRAPNILSAVPDAKPEPTAPPTETLDPDNKVAVEIWGQEIGEYVGRLVIVNGYLSLKSGDSWWIKDETGSIKIFFQPKQNLTKPKAALGDKLRVTGWVSIYRGVYRIIPASSESVEVFKEPTQYTQQKTATTVSVSPQEQPTVLVASTSNIEEVDVSSYGQITPPDSVAEQTNNDLVLKIELFIAIISVAALTAISYAKIR